MITIAVPKGRILQELRPILTHAGIIVEPAFDDTSSRQLTFSTNHDYIRLIRVRSFDVASFVAHGAAQIGVVGSDVLEEFNYQDIYAPINLHIGKCKLSVAHMRDFADNIMRKSHVRIASKYPEITKRFYQQKNIQADIIKLNGAMELAPLLQLSERIVDLVSTGKTLKANNLVIEEDIMQVASYLIVSRPAYKTNFKHIQPIIDNITKARNDLVSPL